MKRCDIRAHFNEIAMLLSKSTGSGDERELAPFLFQAARIESAIKQELGKRECKGEPCLFTLDRESIIAKVADLARLAIPRITGNVGQQHVDAIATKFGELAANEKGKGWCTGCPKYTG